jgi:ATP-binding cassette subfamily F protein 3
MISITNLSKNYGRKILFQNISLNINQGEKIGLVGPNGSGKTTLFSLILRETEPSAGNIQINKGIRIGYLPQESSFKSERTVLSEVTEGEDYIIRLEKEKKQLEEKDKADSERYAEILHELESLGYFELEYKAKKVLMGLGFKEKDFNRLISQMSGGWQMRTLLAKLFVFRYDILLLDEPTNYLDLNAALWFKDFLCDFDGTFIMISHDKAFLTEVTNYTLILEDGVIFKVRGNYEHYERIKEEKRTYLQKQFKEQERKRQQLQRFVDRFHAQPNKAAAVRAKRRVLEKMEEIIVPHDPRESIRSFHFPPTRRSGHSVMKLEKISKSYADIQVYRDFDFEIVHGEKAVLVGENGAGKSTLLKILGGIIDIDSGMRSVGHNVEIGYFSQTRMDVLNPDNTVLQEAYSAAPGHMSEEAIRTILGAFLFTGDDADKKVKVLSGGEKSRLILAKLLINPPNFLLLDEPTTHLDVDAVEALVKALTEYSGTAVFISHDIYFVRSIANVVFEVKNGRVRKFPGNFDYYLSKVSGVETSNELEDKTSSLTESIVAHKPRIIAEERKIVIKKEEKAREAQKREEVDKGKAHNRALIVLKNKLLKERDKLKLEHYAKSRALSKPHIYRDEETIKQYASRLKEIEKRLLEIGVEIRQINAKKVRFR